MPVTNRLYYTDAYATKMHSQVATASDNRLRIALAETIFYPTSGGQPHDLGTINGIPVTDVVDEDDTVIHVLAAPVNEAAVEGEIFWPRRYDHMQQHTGQHLISAVFEQLFGMVTLSFHMGAETSTIELDTKEVSAPQVEAVTRKATELARANPPVRVAFEDAGLAQDLRKSSKRQGIIRIVEVPGIDKSACGGTHVSALAEVLPIQIREQEKVRGNVRVSFVCGDRCLARSLADFEILSQTAHILAQPLDNIHSHVTALQQRLAENEKTRQRLELESAARAGLDLYSATNSDPDGCRRVTLAEPLLNDLARARAKAFAGQPKAIMLMHSPVGVLIACSSDSGVNAGMVLKQSLSKFGAKGGGSATLAQGSLPDASMLADLRRALGQS